MSDKKLSEATREELLEALKSHKLGRYEYLNYIDDVSVVCIDHEGDINLPSIGKSGLRRLIVALTNYADDHGL